MKEIWVDIIGYEGLYQVSNYGRVKSLERYNALGRLVDEKILKGIINRDGYLFVNLSKNGVEKPYTVHRLVSEAFLPNPYNKPIAHHKDHNKLNNNVDNLVWLTHEEHKAEHPEVFEASRKVGVSGMAARKVCSKHINQFTKDGFFVRAWYSSHDIRRELGYSNSNIIKCCKGKYKTAYGYIWKYAF